MLDSFQAPDEDKLLYAAGKGDASVVQRLLDAKINVVAATGVGKHVTQRRRGDNIIDPM